MSASASSSPTRPWLPAMLLAAAAYAVLGLGTAALSRSATTHAGAVTWRLVAWLGSAAAALGQLLWEHFRGDRAAAPAEMLPQQLAERRSGAAGQATQLAELHERVDFAERVLTQVRERSALKNPDERK